MKKEEPYAAQQGQELPPFVKTWKQFYGLLICWLVFLILFFYAFTEYYE